MLRPTALLVLLAPLVGCADSFLLHPTTDPRAVPARTVRRTIPTPEGELEAWVRASPGVGGAAPAAFDVEFCGNASRAERMVERWSERWGDRSVEVWAVNYPGFGGSSGDACLRRCVRAAEAAFDHVAAEADGRPVFVGGSSLGSTFALHLAVARDVAGVLVRNPPPLREMILWKHGWWNLWLLAVPVALQVPEELDGVENARRSEAPAVFLSATRDGVVPPAYQRRVFDAYAGPTEWIEFEGRHSTRL
ncbi:MAG: alpha/beta hydrolase, partial [Planctomycetota bacterium JB042]